VFQTNFVTSKKFYKEKIMKIKRRAKGEKCSKKAQKGLRDLGFLLLK